MVVPRQRLSRLPGNTYHSLQLYGKPSHLHSPNSGTADASPTTKTTICEGQGQRE